MSEILFTVRRQDDGWYLATTANNLRKGRIITEAPDYQTLLQKVEEATKGFLRDGYHEDLGLPPHPRIRLQYSEMLFQNPAAPSLLIAGKAENKGYRAQMNGEQLQLDLYHQSIDGLRDLLCEELQRLGHHGKNIEFKVEELISPELTSTVRKSA